MGRLIFFTREALRAMRKNVAPTTAARILDTMSRTAGVNPRG